MPRTAAQPSTRVYTRRDETVERALAHVVEFKLVSESASVADKVHVLIALADERLVADHEREQKLSAYRVLAEDEERRKSIREASFAALENGIL